MAANEINIRSVSHFVDEVMNWTLDGEQPVAFRGQAFEQWHTQPKIYRNGVGIDHKEKEAVRDLVSIHPQEFRDDQTMFDRLVRMQHFELPTRLLDVTTNPLVALYFATASFSISGSYKDGKVQAIFIPEKRRRYYDSDRVSCMANIANLTLKEKGDLTAALKLEKDEFNKQPVVLKLISFVRAEKFHFTADIDPADIKLPVFVKPKMNNRRIIAQSGAFILFGRKRSLLQRDSGLRLKRLIIQHDKKAEIREQLDRLGLHAGSLFPEIDKAAQIIANRYATMGR